MAIVFAGSWCNNMMHHNFVFINYIKKYIILSFQFVATNAEVTGTLGLSAHQDAIQLACSQVDKVLQKPQL